MTCDKVRDYYLEYVEQSLGAAQTSEFEAHLSGCARCSRELKALRWTTQTLRSMPAVTPPAELRPQVWAELYREQREPRPSLRERLAEWLRPRRWALPAVFATAVAAVLLFAVALPNLHQAMSPSPSAPSLMEKSSGGLTAMRPPAAEAPASPLYNKGSEQERGLGAQEPPLDVQVNPRPGQETFPSPGGAAPFMGAPSSPSYPSLPNKTGSSLPNAPRIYSPQVTSPYTRDITRAEVQRDVGAARIDTHPPSNNSTPSAPPGSANLAKGERNTYLAQAQPNQRTQEGGSGTPTGNTQTPGGLGGGNVPSTPGTPGTTGASAIPAPAGSAGSTPGTAGTSGSGSLQTPSTSGAAVKSSGSDVINRDDQPKEREQPPSETIPLPKPPASNAEESKSRFSITSPLRTPTQVTLYLSRSEMIAVRLQPDTDLFNAEVWITPPSNMQIRDTLPLSLNRTSRIGEPRVVFRGHLSSKRPFPVTFYALPFATGRHVLQVTLRSPSLAQPVTERIVVDVKAGQMGWQR